MLVLARERRDVLKCIRGASAGSWPFSLKQRSIAQVWLGRSGFGNNLGAKKETVFT